jgi:hypothetical protein
MIDVLDDAQAARQLGATFDAAVGFGLDEKEILAILVEVCSGGAGLQEPFEELSAALAHRILEHERSTHG